MQLLEDPEAGFFTMTCGVQRLRESFNEEKLEVSGTHDIHFMVQVEMCLQGIEQVTRLHNCWHGWWRAAYRVESRFSSAYVSWMMETDQVLKDLKAIT